MRAQETHRLQVARDPVRAGIEQPVARVDDDIANVAKAIRELIGDDADVRTKRERLDSISGLGERTIATLLAFLADPARFDNARAVAAFAGLNPRQHRFGIQRQRQDTTVQGRSCVST